MAETYEIYNKISRESQESKVRIYNSMLTEFLERMSMHSTQVVLPDDMEKTKKISSLKLYSDTIKKFSEDIVKTKNPLYEFENALKLNVPKNLTESITSAIAKYVEVDGNKRHDYVKRMVGTKVASNESFYDIENFIEDEFSKENFFDENNGISAAYEIKSIMSYEAKNIVDEIRNEVMANVADTENKNQIFRKTLEIIEEKKDELEEKNGVEHEDSSSSDDSDKDSDNDKTSEESLFSLENALIGNFTDGRDVSKDFDFNGEPINHNEDELKNIYSTSSDDESLEDGEDFDVPDEGDETEEGLKERRAAKKAKKLQKKEMKKNKIDEGDEGESEDEGDDGMSQEDFCKRVAPKSLNKFYSSPTINPKRLAQYMLSREDSGSSLINEISDRLTYISNLANMESSESLSSESAINETYDKIEQIKKSLEIAENIRNNAIFDLSNIGFSKIDELNEDEPFGDSVKNVIETGKYENSTERLILSTIRKNELMKEVKAGRNISQNIDKIGSIEEFINETIETVKNPDDMRSKLKSLENLEDSIDFTMIVDTNKLKKKMEEKVIAKDQEAFEKEGEWTDTTSMFSSVLEKLKQTDVVKNSTGNVDLEYIVDCALNSKSLNNSVFERILSKLSSSEGYSRLTEGQQYNVGKSILTTFVAANKLDIMSQDDKNKLFSL